MISPIYFTKFRDNFRFLQCLMNHKEDVKCILKKHPIDIMHSLLFCFCFFFKLECL